MGVFQLFIHACKAFWNLRKAMKQSRARGAKLSAQDAVMEAYRRGDYQAAIEASRRLGDDRFFAGNMLLLMGRLNEAEQWLRQAAEQNLQPRMAALVQTVLGQVLMEQDRYDEAMKCWEKSLSLWPERGGTHRDIAESYLRRGNSAEGLRWARLALEKEKAGPGLSAESKQINLGTDLATLAWAVAVHTRDAAEVERLSDEVSMPAATPASSIAQSNYHFGKAWVALGDARRSAVHFEAAARVDPNGMWGRAAAAMAAAAHQ